MHKYYLRLATRIVLQRIIYANVAVTNAAGDQSNSLSGLGMKLRKAWKLALYFRLSSL